MVSPRVLAVDVMAFSDVWRSRMLRVVGRSDAAICAGGSVGAVSAAMARASAGLGRVRGFRFFIALHPYDVSPLRHYVVMSFLESSRVSAIRRLVSPPRQSPSPSRQANRSRLYQRPEFLTRLHRP